MFFKSSYQTLLKANGKGGTKKSHLFILTRLQQKWKEIRPQGQIRITGGDLSLRSQAQ